MNGLNYNDQPLGIIKAHSLQVLLTRRYFKGHQRQRLVHV